MCTRGLSADSYAELVRSSAAAAETRETAALHGGIHDEHDEEVAGLCDAPR
jgi:hypothetical protein